VKFINIFKKRKLLLSYTLTFDSNNQLSIKIDKFAESISNHDYIRLWALYQVEMMVAFNYSQNIESVISISMIEKIVEKEFDDNTDCFERAKISENISYTEEPVTGLLNFTGDFYSKKQSRFLTADFLLNIDNKHAVYGGIGLLQYSINRCKENPDDLDLVYHTAKHLELLFKTGDNNDQQRIKTFPDTAYALAIRSSGDLRRVQ